MNNKFTINELQQAIKKIFIDKRTVMVGDFNAHNKMWGRSQTNSRGNFVEEILM